MEPVEPNMAILLFSVILFGISEICSPHQFVSYGGKERLIFHSDQLQDETGFAYGDFRRGTKYMILRIGVQTDATLRVVYIEFYFRVFWYYKRSVREVMGSNGSKTQAFGLGAYYRTSATHGIGCGTRWRRKYQSVGGISTQVFSIDEYFRFKQGRGRKTPDTYFVYCVFGFGKFGCLCFQETVFLYLEVSVFQFIEQAVAILSSDACKEAEMSEIDT